jgi:NAD-dependent deacetylase
MGWPDLETALGRAIDILADASTVVAFTGAGISTESGIPDFRSAGGLWERFDPAIYANYGTFLQEPRYIWELEVALRADLAEVAPNPGHQALVDLERMGKLTAIITQNIDYLHQRAGSTVPIHELHGSGLRSFCVGCGTTFDTEPLVAAFREAQVPPKCPECDGAVKPGVVLFGEALNSAVLGAAVRAAQEADAMIVVGSSLTVSPANQLPLLVLEQGGSLILVNRDTTILDGAAHAWLQGSAGELLPRIVRGLRERAGT